MQSGIPFAEAHRRRSPNLTKTRYNSCTDYGVRNLPAYCASKLLGVITI